MKDLPQGIVFDANYTDSLLRMLSGKQDNRVLSRRRTVSRKEVLTNILLFGHAHLSHPYWLMSPDFSKVSYLEQQGLISWIPDDYYVESLSFVRGYARCLDDLFGWLYLESLPLSLDMPNRGWRSQLSKTYYGIETQLELMSFYQNQLLKFEPLIKSNLRHVNLNLANADWLFRRPIFHSENEVEWLPDREHRLLGLVFDELLDIELSTKRGIPSFGIHAYETIESERLSEEFRELFPYDDLEYRVVADIVRKEASVLDAVLATVAIEKFAGETGNPVQLNVSYPGQFSASKIAGVSGTDLYQLVQVQFKNLRYPVIETIEDVLRLRDDPHLDSYREVVFSYSQELRSALANERYRILEKFRSSLNKALGDLARSYKWTRYLDLTFYLSIPLAIAGVLTGIPLSDIVSIPVGGVAKLVSSRTKRRTDWLMFGRQPVAANPAMHRTAGLAPSRR